MYVFMTHVGPISNLSFTSHLLEKFIHSRIVIDIAVARPMPRNQSAYPRNNSTETALLKRFKRHRCRHRCSITLRTVLARYIGCLRYCGLHNSACMAWKKHIHSVNGCDPTAVIDDFLFNTNDRLVAGAAQFVSRKALYSDHRWSFSIHHYMKTSLRSTSVTDGNTSLTTKYICNDAVSPFPKWATGWLQTVSKQDGTDEVLYKIRYQ